MKSKDFNEVMDNYYKGREGSTAAAHWKSTKSTGKAFKMFKEVQGKLKSQNPMLKAIERKKK